MIRSISLLTLVATAISAQAADVYSNLGSSPAVYDNSNGYVIGGYTQGAQFTATGGGTLTGFMVAMDNYGSVGPTGYTLSLYADSGSNTLGTLLGTYAGVSTGIDISLTSTALSSVAAGGPAVNIANGGVYWLIASSNGGLGWAASNSATGLRYTQPIFGIYPDYLAAFSVQVADAPPVPAPLAALPFALGLLKRRRKA